VKVAAFWVFCVLKIAFLKIWLFDLDKICIRNLIFNLGRVNSAECKLKVIYPQNAYLYLFFRKS
jgi:hypothetical protein